MRIVIVSLLTGQLGRDVAALREEYDAKTHKAIGPHLTIGGPVETDVSTESILSKAQAIASKIRRFHVTGGSVANFLPTSNTIFIEIENCELLQNLHAVLSHGLNWEEKYKYHPHITITEYLSQEQTQSSFLELNNKWNRVPTKHFIDELSFLAKNESGIWESVGGVRLRE